jgi:DNA-binding response OmpR family regulator
MSLEQPALVLLDLMMPEMDGFAVLEEMRLSEMTRNIPVVVITGQVLTEEDMQRLNSGVASVLGKGMFSVEETLAHLANALAHKRKPVRSACHGKRWHIFTHITTNRSRRHSRMGWANGTDRCFHQEVGMTRLYITATG